MPTYDYECKACDHKFEKFQSITAKSIRKCPSCKKLKVKRLIGTGAGIIFKGSGFYQTDYRSSAYQEAAKKDKPSDGTTSTDKTSDKTSSTSSDNSTKLSAKNDSSGSLAESKKS